MHENIKTENNITKAVVNDNIIKTDKNFYLSVVMPAYNEGEHIKDNLLLASKTISTFINNYQLLVVNDGSTDNTLEQIGLAKAEDAHIKSVSYKTNRGKGHAISTGVKFADAEYIAFLDADLELNPIMLRYFLKALQATGADIAIGSKLHKKSKLNYPFTRKLLSLGYYLMLKTMFSLDIKDTQTGIKLFKGDVLKPICEKLTTDGFAYDIEILAIAAKQGKRIIELPIELKYSRSSKNKSKISIKRIFDVFIDTIKIKRKLKKL